MVEKEKTMNWQDGLSIIGVVGFAALFLWLFARSGAGT